MILKSPGTKAVIMQESDYRALEAIQKLKGGSMIALLHEATGLLVRHYREKTTTGMIERASQNPSPPDPRKR